MLTVTTERALLARLFFFLLAVRAKTQRLRLKRLLLETSQEEPLVRGVGDAVYQADPVVNMVAVKEANIFICNHNLFVAELTVCMDVLRLARFESVLVALLPLRLSFAADSYA